MITLDLLGYSFDNSFNNNLDITNYTLKDPFLLEDANRIQEDSISFRLIKL